jgi:hypothetical protein
MLGRNPIWKGISEKSDNRASRTELGRKARANELNHTKHVFFHVFLYKLGRALLSYRWAHGKWRIEVG